MQTTATAIDRQAARAGLTREAVRRYVERHDEAYLAEAQRQSLAAAARGWTEEDKAWECLGAAWDDPSASVERDAGE